MINLVVWKKHKVIRSTRNLSILNPPVMEFSINRLLSAYYFKGVYSTEETPLLILRHLMNFLFRTNGVTNQQTIRPIILCILP